MKKFTLVIVLLVLVSLTFVGCEKSSVSSEHPTKTPAAEHPQH